MGNHRVKLVNGIYRQQLSKRYHRKSTLQQPVLKEKELVLVSSSSDSLKRYQRKPLNSEGGHNASRIDRTDK